MQRALEGRTHALTRVHAYGLSLVCTPSFLCQHIPSGEMKTTMVSIIRVNVTCPCACFFSVMMKGLADVEPRMS